MLLEQIADYAVKEQTSKLPTKSSITRSAR